MIRTLSILSAIAIVAALHSAGAQQSVAPTTAPKDLVVAPNAPTVTDAEAITPDASARTGQPANICQDLLAYAKQEASGERDKAKGGKASSDPAKQTGAKAKTATESGAQDKAGPKDKQVDQAQQQSGYSAPVPNDDRSSTTGTLSVEQAQALAGANDLRECQRVVQQMRRVGVALPPGLLALGALREDLLLKSQNPPVQTLPIQNPPIQNPPPQNAPPQNPAAKTPL